MLDVLVFATTTTGLILFARRRPHAEASQMAIEDLVEDLPCPWCYAPTDEDDDRCPTCGRRFG